MPVRSASLFLLAGLLIACSREAGRSSPDDRSGAAAPQLSHPVPWYHYDEEGRYHLVDSAERRIAVFGSDGSYLFSYGGRGGGPGEFRSLDSIVIRDSRVTVFDQAQYRSTVFTTAGELLRIIHPPTGLGRLTGFEEGEDRRLIGSYSRVRVDDDGYRERRGLVIVTDRLRYTHPGTA